MKRLLSYKRLIGTGGSIVKTQGDFKGQAMITFTYDDGYKNNYDIAMPLHIKYGIPATFNIVTDWVKKNHRYSPVMSLADIRDLASKGLFEIAAHSVTHGWDQTLYPETYPDYKKWVSMTRQQYEYEIIECHRQLVEWGFDVMGLVCPFNNHVYDKQIYREYFDYVRAGDTRLETYPPKNAYNLPVQVGTDKVTTVAAAISAIDNAIASKQWITIMMHHVIYPGDTAVMNNSDYHWTNSQLEELLQYISSKPRDVLFPVTAFAGLSYATN